VSLFVRKLLKDQAMKGTVMKQYLSLSIVTLLTTFFSFSCSGDTSTNKKSTSTSSTSNISSYEAKRLAEKYIDSNSLLHGHMGLDYYSNFSNPDKGVFTFFGAVCYGSSEYDCSYESVYLITKNNGISWSVEF